MIHRNKSERTQSVLSKALTEAGNSAATKMMTIHLAIGEISELDQNALLAQWNEISKGTPAAQAQLNFRLITAEVQCMACFQVYHPEGGLIHCPNCGSFGAKILKGEEFFLESIETDNEP